MSNVKGAAVKPSQALNLDVNQQKIFIKFYKSLGPKPATTVRFFDRSDYYSLHAEDAHLAARLVFKSVAGVKCMAPPDSGDQLDYLCLSRGNFELILRELLLVQNYRVEVFTKGGSSGAKANEWSIEFKGSPGNLTAFENLLFQSQDVVAGTSIVGLYLKVDGSRKSLGVACVEQHERLISLSEFDDDDFFSELEALLVVLAPKECVLPRTDGEYASIQTLLERNSVMTTVLKRADFATDTSGVVQDLNNLLYFEKGQQESAHVKIDATAKLLAMSALAATIKYLGLVEDQCNLGHYRLGQLNLKRFVHLDAAAVSALNLLPKPGTSTTSSAYRWQSILGVLDRCRTPQGHRLMSQWVKQPLRNEEIIRDRHDIVQCLVDASCTRTDLYDNVLKKMPDVMGLTKKLMRKKASLQDIYRLYQVVGRVPGIIVTLEELENSTVSSVLSSPLKDSVVDLKTFRDMVEQTIDKEQLKKGEFFVDPTFDEQLGELKESMEQVEQSIQRQLPKASNHLGMDSVKLDYNSHLGYHLRLTLKEEASIRKRKEYQVLDAVKGGVRFTTDRLSSLNADFKEAKQTYEEQQESIVAEIVRVATGYLGPFSALNNQIAQLDCLVSFAIAATSAPIPYIRPRMHPEGSGLLRLTELRHPCLELQEDVTFIANDVHFKHDDTHMYILTGPNMGGKSTYIRSVGCAVLMAHVGAFVPCAQADISIVDAILGRVGADDNIGKGLSTFMVEMLETAGIVRNATASSLVFIDELGRGTSTYEGCGIAWSIAEHLAANSKCFTLFATHFQEISELAKSVSTVRNFHMVAVADRDVFTLLYQVRPGVMEKSFGIHVARIAQFPADVLQTAQRVYDECEDHYTQLQAQNDAVAQEVFRSAIDRCRQVKVDDSEAIEALAAAVRAETKNTDSQYFRTAFPRLFE